MFEASVRRVRGWNPNSERWSLPSTSYAQTPVPPPARCASEERPWRRPPSDSPDFEASGEPGRLGLVALWNAWVAMRYRALIPGPTFALLTQPWETVVGPLPAP